MSERRPGRCSQGTVSFQRISVVAWRVVPSFMHAPTGGQVSGSKAAHTFEGAWTPWSCGLLIFRASYKKPPYPSETAHVPEAADNPEGALAPPLPLHPLNLLEKERLSPNEGGNPWPQLFCLNQSSLGGAHTCTIWFFFTSFFFSFYRICLTGKNHWAGVATSLMQH